MFNVVNRILQKVLPAHWTRLEHLTGPGINTPYKEIDCLEVSSGKIA